VAAQRAGLTQALGQFLQGQSLILRPSDLVGNVLGFFIEWFCYWALLGSTVGLAAAYYLTDILGIDQTTLSWLLAGIGFAVGFRFDYQDFIESDHSASLAMLGYLSFALILMVCEVLLVLQYFPVLTRELA